MADEFALPAALLPSGDAAYGAMVSPSDIESLIPLSDLEKALLGHHCVLKRRLEFRAGRHVAKRALENSDSLKAKS